MGKYLVLLALCLYFTCSFAQTRGVVIDFETSKPVPYANICIKDSNVGTTSNEKGEFTIAEKQENALLIVSSIGYEMETIAPKSEYVKIYLTPKVYDIMEVTVKPNRLKTEIIVNSLKKKKSNHRLVSNGFSWITAKQFDYKPEYSATPYIKSIKILTNSWIRNAKFNVRLLSVGENGEPSDEIYENNIIALAKRGRRAVNIDLSDKNIRFPENGFFVALEWFIFEDNAHRYTYTKKGSKRKYADVSYEPNFYMFRKYGESETWSYSGGKWFKSRFTPIENEYLDLGIELTLTN